MQMSLIPPVPPSPPPPPDVPAMPDMPRSVMSWRSAALGIECESLEGQLAQYFGVKEGVLVRSVNPKTAAERAGLKAGDVVVKVNGTPVTSPREITGLVRAGRKKAISFTVIRNKKEMSLRVEVAEDRTVPAEREAL